VAVKNTWIGFLTHFFSFARKEKFYWFGSVTASE
jgi:hypothetical protein